MPALPPHNDNLVTNLPETPRSAYVNHILPVEGDPTIAGDANKLVHIRILGALLIHAPRRQAQEWVAKEIISATEHKDSVERLDKLGKFYVDHLVCLCECSLPTYYRVSSLRTCTRSQEMQTSYAFAFQQLV